MSSDARIRKFLAESQNMSPLAAEELLNKLKKHEDIYREFLEFIKTEEYPENGVKSGEYTSKILSERLSHFPAQNIYEFMIGLRDNPDQFEKFILEGAPVLE